MGAGRDGADSFVGVTSVSCGVLSDFSRKTGGVVEVGVSKFSLSAESCCKSSIGIFGTGFLLMFRTELAVGLAVSDDDDVEQDTDVKGPRQAFA